MKITAMFLLILLFNAATAYAHYNYPFKNHLDATISAAFIFNQAEYEKIEIEVKPERAHVPLLENRNKIPLGFFEQKYTEAELVFVIPGAGSGAMADRALNMAELFYKQGYHALTLPNALHFQYVIGVSETGLPGYMPRDAEEYYKFLQKVVGHIQQNYGTKISKFSVVGYSLGGLLTAFLAEQDAQQKHFNFKKVVVLNPAIDINYGLSKLDNFFSQGKKISFTAKQNYLGHIFELAIKHARMGFQPALIQQDLDLFKPHVKEWIIGEVFRRGLMDVIFASQQIHDLGILKTPASRFKMNDRFAEAYGVSFKNYMEEFVMPSLNPSKPKDGLFLNQTIYKSSLYGVLDVLKSQKNIYIFTNEDDFLNKPEDLVELTKTIDNERLKIYPLGGHSGNYWMPQNQLDLLKAIKY